MKKMGTTLIVVGFLYAIYNGINLILQERELNIIDIQLIPNTDELYDWSPTMGIYIMLFGVALLLLGWRKKEQILQYKLKRVTVETKNLIE